jgi:hypothetical protein
MAEWTRAKACSANSCIEVLQWPDGVVAIRNSRSLLRTSIFNSADEWAAFVAGVRAGDFDHIGKADPA